MRVSHIAVATAAVALTGAAAAVGRATAPPIGHIPDGPSSTMTTDHGEFVAVALPHRSRGRSWRLVRNDSARVLTEVREADVGAQVVVVFKTLAAGKATLVFALTRGERPKVYESRRFAVEVR
jgi:hypothetical protein